MTASCPWPEKQVHSSKAAAQAAIGALYRAGRGNPDLAAYPCPAGHWHVGHDVRHFAKRIQRALAAGRGPGTTYRRNRRRKR